MTVFGVILLLVAGGLFYGKISSQKKLGDMAYTETSEAGALLIQCKGVADEIGGGSFSEYCEIKGTASIEQPMKAEFSGTDCVYYKYQIEELRSSGKNTRWVTIAKGDEHSLFFLKDETGLVLVDSRAAKIDIRLDNKYNSGWGNDPGEHTKQFLAARNIKWEGFLLGATSGAGYALFENLTIGAAAEAWSFISITRLGTAAVHILTAGLMGWGLAQGFSERKFGKTLAAFSGAVLVHGVWNGLNILSAVGELTEVREMLGPFLVGLADYAPAGLILLALGSFWGLIRANKYLRRAIMAGSN